MDKHYRIPLTGPQIEQKLMEQSVPLQQGADNAGKVLAVDADGNVKSTPVYKLLNELITSDDQTEMLIEADLLPAVTTTSGAILTDSNGNIILKY